MQFDWWSFLLQTINFLVLVWLLGRFLFRPVREVIARRQAMAEEAFGKAGEQAAAAEAAKQRYEAARAELAGQRQALDAALHKSLQDDRDKVLARARQDAERITAEARAQIDEERARSLSDARDQVIGLAADMASGLLADLSGPGSAAAALDRVADYFAALPDSDLTDLKRDLRGEGAQVSVTTAQPLAKGDQDAWQRLLQRRLGASAVPVFAVDPDLLGGAAVRFPHALLDYSWAGRLRDMSRHLQEQTDEA